MDDLIHSVVGEPDLVSVKLACGHRAEVHAASSVFDFPADGAYCYRCDDVVALAPAVIDYLAATR